MLEVPGDGVEAVHRVARRRSRGEGERRLEEGLARLWPDGVVDSGWGLTPSSLQEGLVGLSLVSELGGEDAPVAGWLRTPGTVFQTLFPP